MGEGVNIRVERVLGIVGVGNGVACIEVGPTIR